MGEKTKMKQQTAEADQKKRKAAKELPAPDPADPYAALRLDAQLCFPLYAAARKIVNMYTPYLKPLGITYTQYIVFLALWQEGDLTVGDLCRMLYLDSGTLTPLLKKMEQAGYITRCRSHQDERVVEICLTDKGRELREKVKDIPSALGSCVNLSREEAQTMYRMLYCLLGTDEAMQVREA